MAINAGLQAFLYSGAFILIIISFTLITIWLFKYALKKDLISSTE